MIVIDNFFSEIKITFSVNSLVVSGGKLGFRYLANKYVVVLLLIKEIEISDYCYWLLYVLYVTGLLYKLH